MGAHRMTDLIDQLTKRPLSTTYLVSLKNCYSPISYNESLPVRMYALLQVLLLPMPPQLLNHKADILTLPSARREINYDQIHSFIHSTHPIQRLQKGVRSVLAGSCVVVPGSPSHPILEAYSLVRS
eukprot:GHVU01150119.1.p1 GENE.GHVU01150119.1~~GHVU01150119.1.p1  ORF type:complete len:126 (-),score=1.33 GHVU01150119.1:407-784(-)